MTPSPDTWLRKRLHDGADTLPVPPDLTDTIVGRSHPFRPRREGVRALVQVGLVIVVAALVVVGVSVLKTNNEPPPAAAPPPSSDTRDIGTPASLLGTWELKQMSGYSVPHQTSQGTRTGPLVTFQTDGTWSGSDGCNGLDGTYRVSENGAFQSTTKSTTLMLCTGLEDLPVPANGAVEVVVNGGTAAFYDQAGEQAATYVRPFGQFGPTARLVMRSGEVALSLSTSGSGSCPEQIDSITVGRDNQLSVRMADSPDGPCTADLSRSTDVMAIPSPIDPDPVAPSLDLQSPVTATLSGGGTPAITLLVDTQSLATPLLVTARDWDGSSVNLARLEGVLNVNDQGCVGVGTTVVVWPNTYRLTTSNDKGFAITDDHGDLLAAQGQQVVLAGGVSLLDDDTSGPSGVTHSKCLTENYWTGLIDPQETN